MLFSCDFFEVILIVFLIDIYSSKFSSKDIKRYRNSRVRVLGVVCNGFIS